MIMRVEGEAAAAEAENAGLKAKVALVVLAQPKTTPEKDESLRVTVSEEVVDGGIVATVRDLKEASTVVTHRAIGRNANGRAAGNGSI